MKTWVILAVGVVAGFLFGAVLATQTAHADAPATAVCLSTGMNMTGDKAAKNSEQVINEHLAAGRTHFQDTNSGVVICAW